MKIRTLCITAASVVALSSAAMADDHHANAVEHGLSTKPDSFPAIFNDEVLGHGAGQGSPFFGEDKAVPASRTIEEKVDAGSKPATFIRECDPATHKCQHTVP